MCRVRNCILKIVMMMWYIYSFNNNMIYTVILLRPDLTFSSQYSLSTHLQGAVAYFHLVSQLHDEWAPPRTKIQTIYRIQMNDI